MIDRGRVVILSGPSGVGKDSVIEAWSRVDPRVERVVAYTTRAPRPGERDGVEYRFIPIEDFLRRAELGLFLEHKLVHGNYYATPGDDLEPLLARGKVAVLKVDVQGGLELIDKMPGVLSVFLVPPSFEELERRMRARGLDDEPTIARRLQNAKFELEAGRRYGTQIVNESLEETVAALGALLETKAPLG